MTWDDWHTNHRILTQVGTEVASAETYILQAQEHLVTLHLLSGDIYNRHLAFFLNLYCFHYLTVRLFDN